MHNWTAARNAMKGSCDACWIYKTPLVYIIALLNMFLSFQYLIHAATKACFSSRPAVTSQAHVSGPLACVENIQVIGTWCHIEVNFWPSWITSMRWWIYFGDGSAAQSRCNVLLTLELGAYTSWPCIYANTICNGLDSSMAVWGAAVWLIMNIWLNLFVPQIVADIFMLVFQNQMDAAVWRDSRPSATCHEHVFGAIGMYRPKIKSLEEQIR